jgi:hypothetical protein
VALTICSTSSGVTVGLRPRPSATSHSYRYAWAERAKVVGMPERFAQAALGHNSKAIHRAYAKKAEIIVPSLEEYETRAATAGLQMAKAN